MYLKSLNIQGFKSFPDKTTLDFERGITAVVGPNGSGKSNISDAVSWVLGEQSAKSLRGGKMEDVIFNGTQKRKAMGFSKVSIIIDNQDGILEMDSEQVTIARKYYRSGESEYSINGNAVRLRDVQELLMDTGLGRDGYAVIGQGKISEIVSAKSQDRRQIFEEAAGISKYRYRKNKTERQLESAEENLIRLKDILGEIEERIAPLKSQSDKARKFVEWSKLERELEVSLFINDLKNLKKELADYENKLLISKVDFGKVEKEIEEIESEMKEVYDEINLCSIEIENLRKNKGESEKVIFDNQALVAVFKNDIFHKKESIERLNQERDISGEEISKINLLILKKEIEAEELEKESSFLEEEGQKVKSSLEEINRNKFAKNQKKEETKEEIEKLSADISRLKIEEMTRETRVKNIYERENELKNNIENLLENLKNLKKEVKNSEEFRDILDERIKEEEAYKKAVEEEFLKEKNLLEKSEKTLQNIRLDIEGKNNRKKLLRDLENSMEDFSYSVKTIMNQKNSGEIKGIHGPVSELISVPEKFILATETALSYGIQNIVVESESVAKFCINHLYNKKAGRATFLPLTSVKGQKLTTSYTDKGFLGVASDLVEFEPKYSGIINQLLGRVVFVDNIDNGVNMAKNHRYFFKIVTLDGQVINAGGSLTGGSRARTSGILSRKNEMKSLKKKIEKLETKEEEIAKLNTKKALIVTSIGRKLIKKEESLAVVLDDKMENNYLLSGLIKNLEEKKSLLEKSENEMKVYSRQIDEISLENKDEVLKIQQIARILEEKENTLKTMEEDDFSVNEKAEKYKDDISNFQFKILGVEKELALIEQFVTEERRKKEEKTRSGETVSLDITSFLEEVEEINNKITSTKEQSKELKEEMTKIETKTQEVFNRRRNLEISTTDSRRKEKELTLTREEISKERIRLEERKNNKEIDCDKIIAGLWDEYQLTISGAQEEVIDIIDLQKSQIELKKIKGQIRSLGTVNVSAIGEYKEVLERYNFLSNQIEDVINSKAELKDLIYQLTKTMEEMFLLNFNKINLEFTKIFIDLFGGGKASLSLDNPENLLESGIEIDVQPPGKVIKNISSLSGGEKSFVAIAIYFAILRVRPAPFCLLDEIEAALDDTNVVKFASYLRTLTNNTQFIAISHRRGTMEEADALYGVTMQEEGVSKLLKLELEQVESSLGMKAI